MKKAKRLLTAVLCITMLLSIVSFGGISASAAAQTFSGDAVLVPNSTKVMETYSITYNVTNRAENSATVSVEWTQKIFAGYYDKYRYDLKLAYAGKTTQKTVVAANTWASQASTERQESTSFSITVPVNTTKATTVVIAGTLMQYSGNTLNNSDAVTPGKRTINIPAYASSINTYQVAYDANGGVGAPPIQTKTEGVALTLSATKPTRNGYTFKGWATSKTATTAQYQPGGSYTANAAVTLYAVWEQNTVENIYNLGEETYSFKNFPSWSDSGNCFGMSMTSSGYYNGFIDITSVGGKGTNLYALSATDTVKGPIILFQRMQDSRREKATVAGGSFYKTKKYNISSDWNEVVNYVKNGAYNDKGSLQIGFRVNGVGGHAINFLYYKVVNGQERIYAYDNNFPKTETYFYKDSSGKVFQAPNSTFGNSSIDCICLRDIKKFFNSIDDFDSTRYIYSEKDAVTITGTTVYSLECNDGNGEYVMFEIPDGVTQVTITPLVDNAKIMYLEEGYSFGCVDDDTYGVFTLGTSDETVGELNVGLDIKNAPENKPSIAITGYESNISVDYKSSLIFHSIAQNMPTGTNVVWLVADSDGTRYIQSEELVLSNVTSSTAVCAIISDYNGNNTDSAVSYAKTEAVKINVNTSIFAKIIAFFKGIFGTLPKYIDFKKQ